MTRFVITHRRAGKREAWQHRQARAALAEVLHGGALADADVVAENAPEHDEARHVALFYADHEAVHAKVEHPDLVVEPHMEHFAGRARAPEVGEADAEELAADAGDGQELRIAVTDARGRPLAGVDVFAFFGQAPDRRQVARRTDEQGRAVIRHDASPPLAHVAAVPRHSFWPMIHDGPARDLEFRCPALPAAERGVGWWHRGAGLARYAAPRGRGIRVGVIDTGCGPNANLAHVKNLGAVIDLALDENGGADARGHGSHVAGIIGARPREAGEYGGLAAGSTLHSVRVFGPTGGAHQGDIALALWAMAHEQRCHLINLSLGTGGRSEIEHDAVVDALEHGSLCICAGGNTGGDLEYPAAFDETVAVTALGRRNCGPAGSLAAHRVPDTPDRFGRNELYLANFSCCGPGVNACGAGVGIISTVRAGDRHPAPYAAYGGTSMATPYVTGVLAAALARDRRYKAMPRDHARARYARDRLRALCHDVGLAREYQGDGMAVAR